MLFINLRCTTYIAEEAFADRQAVTSESQNIWTRAPFTPQSAFLKHSPDASHPVYTWYCPCIWLFSLASAVTTPWYRKPTPNEEYSSQYE